MKSLLRCLAASDLLCMLSQTVEAGGGKPGTILVTNNSPRIVPVIIDQNIADGTTEQEFLAMGGKVLFPKESAQFQVTAGTHTVVARPVTALPPNLKLGNQASVPFNVESGGTTKVQILSTDKQNVIINQISP